jgi:hypothetical protein
MSRDAIDWHQQALYCLRWLNDNGLTSLFIVKISAQEK